MSELLLDIQKLKKVYKLGKKVKEALKGVSFQINRQEILALLGVNGAGKSTLSSIIASLSLPSSGDILWQGRSIYDDIVAYRRIIGFCPQNQNLDKDLKIEENLIFAGRYYGLKRAEVNRRARFLLEKFNLLQYADAEFDSLSGGYRQRFMIARTVMHKPSLIILDEPTIGLDPSLRRQLWKYILELKDEGASILLTTHYLDEADILADRVCVIHDGEIKTLDSPLNLKKQWKKQNLEDVFLDLINGGEQYES